MMCLVVRKTVTEMLTLVVRKTVVIVGMVVVMNSAVSKVILVLVLIVPMSVKVTVHTSSRKSAVWTWSVAMTTCAAVSMREVHDAGRSVGQAGRTGDTRGV